MKHVKKIKERVFPSAAEMEKGLSLEIFRALERLKNEDLRSFKRVAELCGAQDLTIEQRVELYKLMMFYNTAAGAAKESLDQYIAGFRWNEGEQMRKLNLAIGEQKDSPAGYMFLTLAFIERWNPAGIVMAFMIKMIQKYVPQFVRDGEIVPPPDK
jgi:hypothetical protein